MSPTRSGLAALAALAIVAVVVGAAAAVSPLIPVGLAAALTLGLLYLRAPYAVPLTVVAADTYNAPVAEVLSFNVFLSDLVIVPALPLLLCRPPSLASLAPVRSPLAAMLVLATASTLAAADPVRSLVGTLQLAEFTVLILLTVAAVRNEREVRRVLVGAGAVLALDAALAVGQLVGIIPLPQLALAAGEEGGRVTGLSGNALGAYLVFGLALCIPALASQGAGRLAARLACLLFTVALVATGIRSAWLSALVVILVSVVLSWSYRRSLGQSKVLKAIAALVTVPVVAVVAVVLSGRGGAYLARLESLPRFAEAAPGSTTYSRLRFWEVSLEMLADHPLLGVGLKNWQVLKQPYGLPDVLVGMSTRPISDPHHGLLEVAAERGLLGLAAYLALTVVTVRALQRRRECGFFSWTALPLLVVLVSRPAAEMLGGDVGTDKLWAVALGLTAALLRPTTGQAAEDSATSPVLSSPTLIGSKGL